MTTTTNNEDHAIGRPPADGLVSERPALPGRWRALTVSLVAAFMTLLDVSIVNVALPSIERDLGASAASVQWVVSGYALAFALALVPAGWATPWAGGGCSFSPCPPSWPPAPCPVRHPPPGC
jgi:hypothetical protein